MSDFTLLITGAGLTLVSSIICYLFSYWRQCKDKNKDDKKQKISFLNALESEISNVWLQYFETVGRLVENMEQNEGAHFYYPIFDDYFVVYDKNTNFLGSLDKELSDLIVKTYTIAKGLKDTFTFNNQLLNEVNRYRDLAQETKIEHYKIQYETYFRMWKEYGESIQNMHFDLKQLKNLLIDTIRKHTSSSTTNKSKILCFC